MPEAAGLGTTGWHDFFLLAGTAGATLLGLLFVSVSLKTDAILRSSAKHLRTQAMSAFESLMFVLVLSLIVLVPVSRARVSGGMLIGLALVGFVRAMGHFLAARRGVANSATLLPRRRLFLPALAYVFIAWSGIDVMTDAPGPPLQLLVATLWLLVTATRGAWHLLVEVGEGK